MRVFNINGIVYINGKCIYINGIFVFWNFDYESSLIFYCGFGLLWLLLRVIV